LYPTLASKRLTWAFELALPWIAPLNVKRFTSDVDSDASRLQTGALTRPTARETQQKIFQNCFNMIFSSRVGKAPLVCQGTILKFDYHSFSGPPIRFLLSGTATVYTIWIYRSSATGRSADEASEFRLTQDAVHLSRHFAPHLKGF
jgi:hypothetical protein